MKSILKVLDRIEEVLAAAALVVMTALTFANVVSRHLLNTSLSFSEEITTYLFVLVSLLGTAIAAKRKAHLGLTAVPDLAGPRTRKVLLSLGYGIGTIFCAAIFYYGILMVRNQIMLGQVTAAMQWPEWIYGSFVPFGAFFATVRFLQVFIEEIRSKPEKEEKIC